MGSPCAIQAALLVPQSNALPTGGQVVAGNATINSTSTANAAVMNINQTSQRAVVNWDSFNVGKNATVNFNQPNANAVTLNRVTGGSASVIDGAIRANGQVILVNSNGVTFGRGSEVNAAAVVASTLNIANHEFMEGKNTFKDDGTGQGSKAGKIINKGTISTNQDGTSTEGGFIALLAPEVRNQGYLLAQKGGTVAIGSGTQISLHIQGQSLVAIKVDQSVYNGLISNKHIIEAPGGLVVLATGAANQLMAGVIQNTGRISANSLVNNGGTIELVAKNITQAGTVSANSQTKEGGQINLVGQEITVAQNSQTTSTGATAGGQVNIGLANTQVSGGTQVNAPTNNQTAAGIKANADAAANTKQLAKTVTIEQNATIDTSATQSGNGGAIAIWSELKTTVAGLLKSMGGALSGNGGFIETSSKGQVSLAPTASINTGANNQSGKAGTWLLDPVDLMIDISAANIVSNALSNSNVTIAVTANTSACSLGICILNGSGSLIIASGANILKAGTNYTTLTLSAAGNFLLNGSITGQNLDVIIQSSIAYLGVGSSIHASKVTVQAQTILSYGRILVNNYLFSGGAGTLGNAIELLAQSIFISGILRLNAGLPIVPVSILSPVDLNLQNVDQNLNKIFSSTAANDPTGPMVTPLTQAASNAIYLTATQMDPAGYAVVGLEAAAEVLANGTTGGSIYLKGSSIYTRTGSLLQANGTAGSGGMIGMKADDIVLAGEMSAGGSTNGGSITLIADTGLLDLQSRLISANGGTGSSGVINAQVSGTSLLMANAILAGGSPSIGIDVSKILFLRESVSTAAAGALSLGYEIVNTSGALVTLGTGTYANLSITGTPSYFSNDSAITNSAGIGSYSDLIVKGLTLNGTDSSHFMLVSIPVALTVTAAQPLVTRAKTVVSAPPPPPPPPPASVSPPLALPAPAKFGVASTLSSTVDPKPPIAANAPPPAAGGEVSASAPMKASPLVVLADGSIQFTPAPPPNAPAAPPSAVAGGNLASNQSAPPSANPPPANRPPPAREGANNNSEPRRNGATKDGVEKADSKDQSTKPTTGQAKYVSKYANGFRNGDKPAPKEGRAKDVAGTKPNAPREGKYSNRINAINNNPAAIAAMNQNPFAGNISPFPPGVPHIELAPTVIRGGDSLAQSYDDVPSIRNSGVANVGRSRNTENYYESLESVNLMSTLNLFIVH